MKPKQNDSTDNDRVTNHDSTNIDSIDQSTSVINISRLLDSSVISVQDSGQTDKLEPEKSDQLKQTQQTEALSNQVHLL